MDRVHPVAARGRVAASTTSSRVRRSGAELRRPGCRRRPAARSSSAASSSRTSSRSPSRSSTRPSSSAAAASGVGRAHARPGRSALQQRVELVLQHQPAAVQHADPGAQLLDLGEQVAGQEHRGAGRVQLEQQVADLADALRVEAVGRLVEHQQPWLSQQRGGQPEPLPHAQGVRPHRPAVDAAEPDPVERVVDPAGPAWPGGRRGPMASNSARLARPDRWAYAAGPSTSAPTCGSTSPARARHRSPEHLDRARTWPAPARAASARWWSCPTRWRRGSRRRRPRGRRGRRRRRRAIRPEPLGQPPGAGSRQPSDSPVDRRRRGRAAAGQEGVVGDGAGSPASPAVLAARR